MKPKLTLRDLFWLMLVVAASHCFAVADDATPSTFPDALSRRLLKWLPEDTETVVVAHDFVLAPLMSKKDETDADRYDLKPLIFYLASSDLMPFLAQDKEKYAKPLTGTKVKLALCGSRNYEVVSAFGSMRCEDCAVLVFDASLGKTGDQWLDLIRRGAKRTRKLHGQEVFVFPSQVVKEGFVKLEPWEGTYLALIEPNTLLCATSDRYLEEVLKRRADAVSNKRALPDELPEWGLVDRQAQAWMVRHVPDSKSPLMGLTWSWKGDQLRAAYLPNATKADEVERNTKTLWKDLLKSKHVGIAKDDEKIRVSFRTKDVPLTEALLLANCLAWTQMNDGNQP